jgi:hypothetical protein
MLNIISRELIFTVECVELIRAIIRNHGTRATLQTLLSALNRLIEMYLYMMQQAI